MSEDTTHKHNGHESPTANWIVGEDAHGAQSYIFHTTAPAFLAKVSDDPEEGVLSVLSYGTKDDRTIYDFIWFDDCPDQPASFGRLMREAERALENYRDLD
jgi:hypothetical protein